MDITLPTKALILTDDLEIQQAFMANKMLSMLFEFDNYLRNEYKYQNNEAASPIRERFKEMMDEHGINLEVLYP